MAERVRKELDRLENPWPKHPYFGNGIKVPSIDGKPDKNIVERLGVGGSDCDCCGKSRLDVIGGLWRCTCCKNAYYCSQACQKKQWNDGHRGACRAPGEIKAGDYMMVTSLVNRSELNASVGRVIRWVEEEGRFKIAVDGQPNTFSILPENLLHLRPAK